MCFTDLRKTANSNDPTNLIVFLENNERHSLPSFVEKERFEVPEFFKVFKLAHALGR